MYKFKLKHILNTSQFSKEDLDYICSIADKMKGLVRLKIKGVEISSDVKFLHLFFMSLQPELVFPLKLPC